jgi:putative tryptophan/tyrosine transport system permease protein
MLRTHGRYEFRPIVGRADFAWPGGKRLAVFIASLVVQSQGYADVTMGFGVLVNALAALIIGEAIIGRGRIERQLAAPVVGALIYYQLVSLGLATGLHPSDLKFVTATFVLITLAVPLITGRSKSIVGA